MRLAQRVECFAVLLDGVAVFERRHRADGDAMERGERLPELRRELRSGGRIVVVAEDLAGDRLALDSAGDEKRRSDRRIRAAGSDELGHRDAAPPRLLPE